MSNLIRDLAPAVVEFGVVQGWNTSQKKSMSSWKESRKRNRQAVISNVSAQSQPAAGSKQDGLVYVAALSFLLAAALQ